MKRIVLALVLLFLTGAAIHGFVSIKKILRAHMMKKLDKKRLFKKKFRKVSMETNVRDLDIRYIIGLGNPGKKFEYNRHNIGFRIVNELAARHSGYWNQKKDMETAEAVIGHRNVLLVKPLTYMNESGRVVPQLKKDGLKVDNMLVVHDELELAFGNMKMQVGGSHKGHNGLKSIISYCGSKEFARFKFGIGRPESREEVSNYVLQNFDVDPAEVEQLIDQSVVMIEKLFE